MVIPLVDLQAQYQTIRDEVVAAIDEVLSGMHLFLGPHQQTFERDFAAYSGAHYGVTVANGTDALVLALRACGVGAGDEVITVSNTFIATVEAIALVGATPVFVDIDPDTYVMNWQQLEQVLTPRTRAVIPVHLYGYPAPMGPILDFARAHGLRVIEDASQAHGATYHGQKAGSMGDIGCFSLYYSKNLGAYGEAGICLTNNANLAEQMKLLRDHGSRVRYQHEIIGTNSRMDEIQAAILNIKLRYLDTWNAARWQHAQAYSEQLRGIVRAVPVEEAHARHVYYVYVVQVDDRERVRAALDARGIATGIHYPIPIHLQPACAHLGYGPGALPVTEAVADRILSLPMYPELTPEQVTVVSDTVREAVRLSAKVS